MLMTDLTRLCGVGLCGHEVLICSLDPICGWKDFGGLHICMAREYATRTIPRRDKDDDLCGAGPGGLGTRRESEVETSTDAAEWTRYFALACSQTVMGGWHRDAGHDRFSGR